MEYEGRRVWSRYEVLELVVIELGVVAAMVAVTWGVLS